MKKFEQFVEEANTVHNNKYDYSRSEYFNTKIKIFIICPKHGEFWQTPNSHLMGHGCPRCYNEKISERITKTTEKFIKDAKKKHGNKYDYSRVEYVDYKTKVCIICPIHGEFWQKAADHLIRGCRSCSCRYTTQEFIKKTREIHDNKYDYSKVEYKKAHEKVCIICPIHGEFWQKAYLHLQGYGCDVCGGSKKLTTQEFIEKANLVHNNKYDYSKVKYINNRVKVEIICKKHGEFWQTPSDHLQNCGCPACNKSYGEKLISFLLEKNGLEFETQKTFDDCRNINPLPFDFYLPYYNLLIEYDGIQHYDKNSYFWEETLEKRDEIKNKFCKNNELNLIRIPYWYKENKIGNIIKKVKNES